MTPPTPNLDDLLKRLDGGIERHKQTILHDPANGQFGDCFRTAVASILCVDPLTLPHLNRDVPGVEQVAAMREWLGEHGLQMIELGYTFTDDVGELCASLVHVAGDAPFLLHGVSPRGTDHTVVADRTGIIHDPHPSDGGLVGPYKEGWGVGLIVGSPRASLEAASVIRTLAAEARVSPMTGDDYQLACDCASLLDEWKQHSRLQSERLGEDFAKAWPPWRDDVRQRLTEFMRRRDLKDALES